MKVPLMPIAAIANPPAAWPIIDAVSQVAELIDAEVASMSRGTIWESMAENVGPEKARMAPVPAITKHISRAIVQGSTCLEV